MPGESKAVFLSYASEDSEAAQRIADALRAAGVEVWFDKSELRGGDTWDHAIRQQIHDCMLFMPVLSRATEARLEGYFRREWHLAADRMLDMASARAFLVPVVVDDTPERGAQAPDSFAKVQWTRLPGGEPTPAFVQRIQALLGVGTTPASTTPTTPPVAPHAQSARPRRGRWLAMAAVVVVMATGALFAFRGRIADPGRSAASQAEKSIAVLPFVDMSEKHDQEYLSDGISEELINLLAQVPGLRVPARTSSFHFKGKTDDITAIARQLRVANVLEGSIRKSGDRVRITVQLIRADAGYHLWSATYDRKIDDIFQLQDEISAAVVKALKVSLLGSQLPTERHAVNSEAYALYLRARTGYQHGITHADDEVVFGYLRRAVELDPGFARAWAALAIFICGDSAYFDLPMEPQLREEVRLAATRALALDPDLADGHAAMGRFLYLVEWDLQASEKELRRALELDPSYLEAMVDLSDLLSSRETSSPEAEELALRVVDRDPLYTISYQQLGLTYARKGQFNAAEQAYRAALNLESDAQLLPSMLAGAQLYQGRPAQALDTLNKEPIKRFQYLRPVILDRLGRATEANKAFDAYVSEFGLTTPYSVAAVYAIRNDPEHALDWLERAHRRHEILLLYVRTDPDFASMRSDPRFNDLLRKLNLPVWH